MSDVKVICPSRHRENDILTDIDNMILLVDVKEYEKYKETSKCEIITHDNLKTLSEIRQFAYQKFGDVFMVDDDIVSVEKTYLTSGSKMNSKEIYDLIQETHLTAKDLNCSLYGFNNDPSPTHYNQHKPFMLNGYINGSSFGINKDKNLYFNKKTVACESHWINLLNAYYNRFCFIDKRFHFRQETDSTFLKDGGQTGRRTITTEKEDTLLLRRFFGESVVLKTEKNKTKQLHEYQRQLNIRL